MVFFTVVEIKDECNNRIFKIKDDDPVRCLRLANEFVKSKLG